MSIIATLSRVSSAVGAARAGAGLCLAAASPLLSGCGGAASTPPEAVVTVTSTPTVTARVAPPTTTFDTTGPDTVKSDVMGRNFDLGTIVQVQHEGGVPVIILDRWTARGYRTPHSQPMVFRSRCTPTRRTRTSTTRSLSASRLPKGRCSPTCTVSASASP
jgi:hypothetical protein